MTENCIEAFLSNFTAPGAVYRGKPFWAWNGRLDTDELRRQIGVFQQMGFGGFFMHARIGLETPYLGPEWFDAVRACVDEARRLGMEAWLYDEDCWPSGSASGQVTAQPELRAKALVMKTYAEPAEFTWTPDVIAAFAANLAGRDAADIEVLSAGQTFPPDGRSLVAITVTTGDHPDRMNPDAVQAFLSLTHEAYAREIGDAFGSVVPGIFTDEPDYAGCGGALLPWTDRLPAVFQARYGYDLLPRLIELYYNVDGREVSQARWHYHDCLTHLFADSFGRMIGEWCGAHGLSYTGHLVEEDTLMCQARSIGSAMRFYEHMQAPGIDLLMERCRIYNTAKQCTSVARQLGREQRLSEMYGCMGWDVSFEVYKALGDWQAACGINLRCPHLSWFTMGGEAKRDYPASIGYQSPWWPWYSKVEDYFARIGVAMTQGREVRDLLVIHPIETLWAIRTHDWRENPEVVAAGNTFDDLPATLLEAQLDFDYGDEEMLSRHASVHGVDGTPILRVGQADYKAVLVPPLKTLRASTAALLRRFLEAGGLVVFAGAAPRYLDGCPSSVPAELAAAAVTVPAVGDAAVAALGPRCRRLSITDPDGANLRETIYLLREDEQAFYLFVVNTGSAIERMTGKPVRTGHWRMLDPFVRDRRAAFPDVRIHGFAECLGHPLELAADTGAVFAADAERTDAGWELRTSLPRLASRLFMFPKNSSEVPGSPPKPRLAERRVVELAPAQWDIVLSEPNCLVLDRPRYRIGGTPWQGPEEILRIDNAVHEALDIPPRQQMGQPWKRPKVNKPRRVAVELRYAFAVEECPAGDLFLAIECPAAFAAELNGHALSMNTDAGWWVDKTLRKIPIDPAWLHPGDNVLTLTLDYAETFSGLEAVYLLGDFRVQLRGTEVSLASPPRRLALGDWCSQGLPFYAGAVGYRHRLRPQLAEDERLLLRLGAFSGVAVRILIDGAPLGILAWEPYDMDITDAVAAAGGDEIELAIEIMGHRGNSHGPLHLAEQNPAWTGPADFETVGERWREDYRQTPLGLMEPPRLVKKIRTKTDVASGS